MQGTSAMLCVLILTFMLLGGLGSTDAIFYFMCEGFAITDTSCSNVPLPESKIYIAHDDLAKFYGGDGTTSSCFLSTTFRYYSLWCNQSTGTYGAQEYIKPDCSDGSWAGNPYQTSSMGVRTRTIYIDGDC